MADLVIVRGEGGKFAPGTVANPGGRPPDSVSGAFRQLMREVEIVQGETPFTRAQKLAAKAYERAMSERRDAVLWAKLIIERCDGPAKADIADSLGFAELAAREHARWIKDEDVADAEFRAPTAP